MNPKTIFLFAVIQILYLQSVFSQTELTFDSVFTIQVQGAQNALRSKSFVVPQNYVYKITSTACPFNATRPCSIYLDDSQLYNSDYHATPAKTPYWVGPGTHTLKIFNQGTGFINGLKFKTN